jgi:hypothetical protein
MWTFWNRIKTYAYYFLVQIVVVFCVIMSFKLIHPKEFASLFAGSSFVIGCFVVLYAEWLRFHHLKSLTSIATMLFLFLFAIPIFGVRLLNYGIPFDQLKVWGIPSPMMHGLSNYGFILMVLVIVFDGLVYWKKSDNLIEEA